MEDKIGSLDIGKCADIAIVALDHPALQPINDIEAALVFSSSGRDVIETYVNGKSVFRK